MPRKEKPNTGRLDFHLTGLREMGTSDPIDRPLVPPGPRREE